MFFNEFSSVLGIFASVSDVCFKCFICLQAYVANVSSRYFKSCCWDPPATADIQEGEAERARAVSTWGQEAWATFIRAQPPHGHVKRSADVGVWTRISGR
jgi:hypothetical protein